MTESLFLGELALQKRHQNMSKFNMTRALYCNILKAVVLQTARILPYTKLSASDETDGAHESYGAHLTCILVHCLLYSHGKE